MAATPRVPKYRHHPNGQAFIEFGGRRTYLGKADTPESHERYRVLVNQILTNGVVTPKVRLDGTATLDECVLAYLLFAEGYYGATKEFHHFKTILRDVSQQFGSIQAVKFGPLALQQLRDAWILRGWCRSNINHQVNRVRRFLRWCGAQEIIPGEIAQRLECLEPLRAGKTRAKEAEKVRPVSRAAVDALLPYVSPTIAAMIQIQCLCGMRSQDVCQMHGAAIDRSGDVWLYRVPQHKGTHLARVLVKAIPAKAQAIMAPFLRDDGYLFSPAAAAKHLGRKLGKRKSHTIRERYSSDSYRKAIEYGFAKAKRRGIELEHWHPHQLRHLICTEVSQLLGQQKAQRWLGHEDLETTAIYDEVQVSELVLIARELDRRWAS